MASRRLRPPLQLRKTPPAVLLPPHRIVVVFFFRDVDTPIRIEHLLRHRNVNHGRHWQASQFAKSRSQRHTGTCAPPLAGGVCHLRKINKSVWYRLMNVDHSSFAVKNGQTYLWPQVIGICGETERNVPCASRGRRRRRNNLVSVVVHIPVSVPVPVAIVVVVGGGKGAIGRRECPLMLSSGGKENGPLID